MRLNKLAGWQCMEERGGPAHNLPYPGCAFPLLQGLGPVRSEVRSAALLQNLAGGELGPDLFSPSISPSLSPLPSLHLSLSLSVLPFLSTSSYSAVGFLTLCVGPSLALEEDHWMQEGVSRGVSGRPTFKALILFA